MSVMHGSILSPARKKLGLAATSHSFILSLAILLCTLASPAQAFAERAFSLSPSSSEAQTENAQRRHSEVHSEGASVIEVFNSLIESSSLHLPTPATRLKIEDGLWANAFVRGESEIVVTTPLVQQVKDRSEIAFVMAHELSHLALKHSGPADTRTEIAADQLALKVMSSAGYNPCSADDVLARLAQPLAASLESIGPRVLALRSRCTQDVATHPLTH